MRTIFCVIIGNESQLNNPDISGAIFTLSLIIVKRNTQFLEGARDVRGFQLTPIILKEGFVNIRKFIIVIICCDFLSKMIS